MWLVTARAYAFQFCLTVNIIACCVPPHSTHLLNYSMSACSLLSRRHMGNRWIILFDLEIVRLIKETYNICVWLLGRVTIHQNIASAWRGAGLIPPNRRHVSDKLKLRPEITTKAPPRDPVEPPTPEIPQRSTTRLAKGHFSYDLKFPHDYIWDYFLLSSRWKGVHLRRINIEHWSMQHICSGRKHRI